MSLVRLLFAWVIASGVGYVLASTASTLFNIMGLAEMGAGVPFSDAINWIINDIGGTAAYLIVIGVGFLIAFPLAWLIKKYLLRSWAAVAYPLAGATAVGVALFLMVLQFEIVPIGGARSTFGFLAQMLAGLCGGLVFEWLRPKSA